MEKFGHSAKITNLLILFSTFRVGSPSQHFRLTVEGFSGNAGVILIFLSFPTLLLVSVLHCTETFYSFSHTSTFLRSPDVSVDKMLLVSMTMYSFGETLWHIKFY